MPITKADTLEARVVINMRAMFAAGEAGDAVEEDRRMSVLGRLLGDLERHFLTDCRLSPHDALTAAVAVVCKARDSIRPPEGGES